MVERIDETWDLTKLYTSFDSVEFQADYKKVENLIQEIDTQVSLQKEPKEKILTYLNYNEELTDISSKLQIYAELTTATNTSHKQANQYVDELESLLIKLVPSSVSFQRWLGSLPNFDKIVSDTVFDSFRFHLNELRNDSQYLLSDGEELLAAQLSTSGSSAWTKLHNQLWSKHLVPIEIDGKLKELPLSTVRNYAMDSNQAMRKKAYEAELNSYSRMEIGAAAALNGIKGESITMSEKRGYNSVLDMVLKDSRMEKSTLDAMFAAIENKLPSFHIFLKHKAKLLGHEGGLPFYDLFAPVGDINKKYSYMETKDFIINKFRNFSDELGDFASYAFENRWIDLRPKEGKIGGGFCETSHSINESRILINSTDTFEDLTTVGHELGHAFHGKQLRSEPHVNTNYPMPLAETASIFCETIIFDAALKDASKEEKVVFLENSISSSTQVIVDIYSRFLFESSIFEKRKDYSVNVETIKELMVDSQKKAYGDGLDHDVLHPFMWACKPHYYSTDYNYYNFPYAFGLLFAKGLYAQYQSGDSSFQNNYNNLLNATGKMSIVDVGKLAGLDLNSQSFWESSLDVVVNEINEFIDITTK